MELPYFQEFYEKYSAQGLKVVAVNIYPDQDEDVPAWKERLGLEFPILVGADIDRIIEDYRLEATPLNFLLDSEGKIVKRFDQYYPEAEEEIEKEIKKILAS
jgi:peroxiredoxin